MPSRERGETARMRLIFAVAAVMLMRFRTVRAITRSDAGKRNCPGWRRCNLAHCQTAFARSSRQAMHCVDVIEGTPVGSMLMNHRRVAVLFMTRNRSTPLDRTRIAAR